ncbi:Histone promoter control protein [Lachnellula willkommii]|uniref:Histone promoter control protein n=1 Tax=Lachnellula willkommii TaxID=215461 RepID=A0A559M4B8_9HELO|nr:Histone promoter control protein [Lachnellula willkommii]
MAPRKSDSNQVTLGSSSMSKKNSIGPGSTATSSAAASPKPPKAKEGKDVYPTPPPLPGSGLMQLGGMGGAPGDGTEFRAPTVILNIPMNGEANKIINFTRMAEDRYGWDALHPRLAAQRDRLARVAAAGAALERNGSGRDSGDDMSLDSDAEGSNVEMGGMSDGRTGTDGGVKKIPRKRKMKEDDYDKDDGFVDDTELLWEEQAAAATDGFFVYSGPLVPEGEKAPVELRPDGLPKRGRGSRGGRGGTRGGVGTRGGAAAAAAHAIQASANINPRTGLPLSGPGSRGGSTTRKPRITKADRERMLQEKLEREKMGTMAAMPAGYGGMASNMGGTPMVFNS